MTAEEKLNEIETNLIRVIAQKQAMLDRLQTRMNRESAMADRIVCDFLEINLTELRNILDHVRR
jgi:hypothetical protein